MKTDLYFQQRWCSPLTLVSGNIRFMRMFAGVPRRWSVKQHWDNWKHGFSELSTPRLDLRHNRKWGQRYYIVLDPSCLSIDPKYMTLNDLASPFYVKFCFAPVCLKLWSLAFEAWIFLYLYWMSSEFFKPKRTAAAWHRVVSLRSTTFLLNIC